PCSASCCSRGSNPMILGSCFDFVHRVRSGHGVQSFRANRASKAIPLGGYVLGNQEMLFLPAGHVTTSCSQSTSKLPLSKPSPARACQLGSSATGPTMVTPYSCWLLTRTRESVYPLSTRCSPGSRSRGSCDSWTFSIMLSSGVVAGVVSTLTIRWGRSSSHVSVKCTLYPTHSTSRLVLYRASVS